MEASKPLSQTEKAVANLIADGKSVSEIAMALGKSNSMVRVHLSSIYRKRNLRGAVDLAIYVWRKRANKTVVGQFQTDPLPIKR